MPQEFQVLQCYQCCTFQVHQVKKSTKWICKLCGEKQSIKKVFGHGSGVDCRHHVQKLNSLRANIDHLESQKQQTEDVEHGTRSESLIEASQHQCSSDAPGRWSRFIEEKNTSEDVEDFGEMSSRDIQFVTDRRDLKVTKNLTKQTRNLKRKRDMSFNNERSSLLESKNFCNKSWFEEEPSPNIQNSTARDCHTGGQGQARDCHTRGQGQARDCNTRSQGQRHNENKHIILHKTDIYAAHEQDQQSSYSIDKEEVSSRKFEKCGKSEDHGIVMDFKFKKNSSSRKTSKWGRYVEAAESDIDSDDDDTNQNNQYLLPSKGDNSICKSLEDPKFCVGLKNMTHAVEMNTEDYIHDGELVMNRGTASSLMKKKNEFQITGTGMSKWGQFCDSPESVTGSSQDVTNKTEEFKDEQEAMSANNDRRTRNTECNLDDVRTLFQGHDSPRGHVRPVTTHSSKNGDNSQSASNSEVTKNLKNTKPLFVIGDITDDDFLI